MNLTATTDNIQVVLGGAVTTNQLQCMSSWRDIGATNIEGRTVVSTNSTTDVNIVAAPAANTRREVEYMSIFNTDTVNATVTVKLDANGTEYILAKSVLMVGEKLEYTIGGGWKSLCALGCLKVGQSQNAGAPVVNVANTVMINGDVTNNNASANTLQDVTGLLFPVVAGQTYWFKAIIDYTAAATTTGSRWTINGPAFTRLSYMSVYSLTATTITTNNATAYQIPAASNTTSGTTTGNTAEIEGFITPSDNGNVQVQFASEISGSAIIAKAGSYVQYIRLI